MGSMLVYDKKFVLKSYQPISIKNLPHNMVLFFGFLSEHFFLKEVYLYRWLFRCLCKRRRCICRNGIYEGAFFCFRMYDVNVHPTKMEVRFTNRMKLYDFIEQNIRETLHTLELIPAMSLQEAEEKKKEKETLKKALHLPKRHLRRCFLLL